MLEWITLTGLDHTLPRYRLVSLCRNPILSLLPLEMAFLISEPRMGGVRYPSISVASSLLDVVQETGQKSALHFCGGVARSALQGKLRDIPGLDDLVRRVDRIQINATEELITPEGIQKAQELLQKPLIFQWRKPDFSTLPQAPKGVQWLFDHSGGNGEAPATWPQLPEDPTYLVGLAGGLGPGRIDPLLRQLGFTEQVFWIDMETGLRDGEDRFSADICLKVLREAWSTIIALEEEHIQKNACKGCGSTLCICSGRE